LRRFQQSPPLRAIELTLLILNGDEFILIYARELRLVAKHAVNQ